MRSRQTIWTDDGANHCLFIVQVDPLCILWHYAFIVVAALSIPSYSWPIRLIYAFFTFVVVGHYMFVSIQEDDINREHQFADQWEQIYALQRQMQEEIAECDEKRVEVFLILHINQVSAYIMH